MLTVISDFLVILGLLVLSMGVYGMVRMPDVYLKLHSASKGLLFGTIPILAAAALLGGPAIASRATMIALLIIFTTPISTHAITKAVAIRDKSEEDH